MSRPTKKQIMCERKEPHKTIQLAEEHLERLKGLPGVTDVERLHIYWCPFPNLEGRHYHVGHRRKAQQRAMELRGLL